MSYASISRLERAISSPLRSGTTNVPGTGSGADRRSEIDASRSDSKQMPLWDRHNQISFFKLLTTLVSQHILTTWVRLRSPSYWVRRWLRLPAPFADVCAKSHSRQRKTALAFPT